MTRPGGRPEDDVSQYFGLVDQIGRLQQTITPEEFRFIGATGQPVFQNGWVNFDAARPACFYRHNGRVYLQGVISGGTLNTAAFVLPDGYWGTSTSNLHYPVVSNSVFGAAILGSVGQIVPWQGSNAWFDLSSIDFRHA